MSDRVSISIDSEGIADVMLNRPDKMNACPIWVQLSPYSSLLNGMRLIGRCRNLRLLCLSATCNQ
jgi:hypothetical protein